MKFLGVFVFLFVAIQSNDITAQDILELNSPDGSNLIEVRIKDGLPYYRLLRKDQELLGWSEMGLKIQDQPNYQSLEVVEIKRNTFSESWKPLWEKSSLIKNEYNEININIKERQKPNRSLSIIFRLYDDGAAWRYEIGKISEKDSVVIENDLSSFHFPAEGTWWAFNGERKNLGPDHISTIPYNVQTPFLFKYPSGQFVAILEGEIRNMSNFTLMRSGVRANWLKSSMGLSKIELPEKTSWRVIMVGDSELALVESNLLVNLNPPSRIEDTSWIKPGLSTWNWRGVGYETKDGYTYQLDTESQKRFIDFASENGFPYHLIDANWYGPEFDKTSDPSVPQADFDVREVLDYAKKKEVGIFLYLNDVGAKTFGLERVLKQFNQWGAVGVKYGFMTGYGQEKVLQTKKVIELCAENELMLFFHDDPIPPSGDHRTWPHVLAREYGHAQADGKYSVFPESAINQPFINMLAGPLDMNFGWFNLTEAVELKKVQQAIPGTVAGELAKMATIFSGYICLPDVPEEYMAKPEMFDFIQRFPKHFDEYKTLAGEIDKYISVLRRAGDNWLVASYTNNESRNIKIPLDFLNKEKSYKVYLYEDRTDSDYLTNKEAYQVRELAVKAEDTLEIFMAPGGGNCMFIEEIHK